MEDTKAIGLNNIIYFDTKNRDYQKIRSQNDDIYMNEIFEIWLYDMICYKMHFFLPINSQNKPVPCQQQDGTITILMTKKIVTKYVLYQFKMFDYNLK